MIAHLNRSISPWGFHLDVATKPLSMLVFALHMYSIHDASLNNIIYYFQVNTNGLLSFGRQGRFNVPQLFPASAGYNYLVAPLWVNIDISNRVGEISYEVHSFNSSYVRSISTFISQNQQVRFNASWMLVVEWNSVPQFGSSLISVSSIK